MNIISVLALVILAISMVMTGFLLAYSIHRNFQKGQLVRKQLTERVNQLRYGKILALFGIDKKSFLHRVSITEVENEMRTCQACKRTNECDAVLQQNGIFDDDVLAFCPNASSIKEQRAIC